MLAAVTRKHHCQKHNTQLDGDWGEKDCFAVAKPAGLDVPTAIIIGEAQFGSLSVVKHSMFL